MLGPKFVKGLFSFSLLISFVLPTNSLAQSGSCDGGQYIFTTSVRTNGAMQAWSGTPAPAGYVPGQSRESGTQLCNLLAQQAGLPGTYRAMMSLTSSSARTYTNVRGKVCDVNGGIIADSESEFWSANHQRAINLDENGNPIYNESGKVMKGPNYFKPDLSKFVN